MGLPQFNYQRYCDAVNITSPEECCLVRVLSFLVNYNGNFFEKHGFITGKISMFNGREKGFVTARRAVSGVAD